MGSYIVLANLTEQGISKLQEFGERARAFRGLAAEYGVTVKDIYWTRGGYDGGYDLVTVLDAPDERAVTALRLAVDARGNLRTLMLRAFPAEVMEEIIAKVAKSSMIREGQAEPQALRPA